MAQGIVVVGSGVDPASYYNKAQVDAALAEKLSTSGGKVTGGIDFGDSSTGVHWVLANGDIYDLRPYSPDNVFQLVRSPADGTPAYGVLNVFENGNIEFARHSNKQSIVMATIEADGIHSALKGNADTATKAEYADSAGKANYAETAGRLSGGSMSEYLDFGQSSAGLSWTCANGDIYHFRAYSPNSVLQMTRQNPNGVGEYGVLNIYGDGSVNVTARGGLSLTLGDDTRSFLDWTYPVGSIYLSVNSTSPAAKFGGAWTPIENLFLYPVPTSTAAGLQGGEAVHTLTVAEMPSHSHSRRMAYGGSNGQNIPVYYKSTNAPDGYGTLEDTGATGGNAAHNNMPPYMTMYAWYRVS